MAVKKEETKYETVIDRSQHSSNHCHMNKVTKETEFAVQKLNHQDQSSNTPTSQSSTSIISINSECLPRSHRFVRSS